MKEFASYVAKVSTLAEVLSDRRRPLDLAELGPALDGEPSRELRRLVPIAARRRDGAFFTGSVLAEQVVRSLVGRFDSSSVIVDPACGAGDLLLACARLFPRTPDLQESLALWGKSLRGSDIHAEFINLARVRMVLLGTSLGLVRRRISAEFAASLFPHIKIGDGLLAVEDLAAATHVVTNPPFTMVQTPPGCQWTSGLVNSAAIFLDVITASVAPGTEVRAILPDVLRSGSRYVKWRNLMNSRLAEMSVDLAGQFSPHADVNVFLLTAKRRVDVKVGHGAASFEVNRQPKSRRSIEDVFSVRVGPVVPYRDAEEGPAVPYITPHDCPPWGTCEAIKSFRRFPGRLFKPPFVVVRRTSRPGDSHRAVGTLVTGSKPVAVENHLLVFVPRSNRVSDCNKLIALLKRATTDKWIDQRICCRHLPVSIVKAIPWPSDME